MINEVEGNLITLALEGSFDVIAHGCNCFCKQKSGLAPQMVKAFNTDIFALENPKYEGDINKLGMIDYQLRRTLSGKEFYVVNAYTQYYNRNNLPSTVPVPLDYQALKLCMRKINHIFKGKHIGLPKIGAGKAGGNWHVIFEDIKRELKDCNVTIVNFKE